ncbi:DUF3239 domain-containing protein [Emticicia fontis]
MKEIDFIESSASNPGNITLSVSKFLNYYDIKGINRIKYEIILRNKSLQEKYNSDVLVNNWNVQCGKFKDGCVNPGILINNETGIMAVFTDMSMDAENAKHEAIKILKIDTQKLSKLKLPNGALVATVAHYFANDKSWEEGRWVDFNPELPHFYSRNLGEYDRAYKSIPDNEWQKLVKAYNALGERRNQEGIYYVQFSQK